MGKKGKKKKSKEEKWVDEIKTQEKKIYDKDHTFSKKEMKIAKRFMEKKKKAPKEEAVELGDEKIFDTSKAKEFNPEEAFKGAKTVGMEDDGEEKVIYAPEPKKEKYVHFADDKDYVEDIEIDQHKFKKAPKGEKAPSSKKKKSKAKKRKE
jgi:hypothetical protein